MRIYFHHLFFCFVVALFMVGCGGNPVLKGKVTFKDGLPLTTGMVVLDNGTITSRAPIQSDGTFTVGTETERDGVPPGTYRVSITGAVEMLDNPTGAFPPPSRPLIHQKYTSAETSGLSVTVDKSPKPFDITVEPPK